VGKPGITAKLKEKIFSQTEIFPRQSRLPAGTDFFQVNKNVQRVGKHLINEARNLKYPKSRSTKSFQENFRGQQFFFYLWNTISLAESRNSKQLQRTEFSKPLRSNPSKESFDSLQSLNLSSVDNLEKEYVEVTKKKGNQEISCKITKFEMDPKTVNKQPAAGEQSEDQDKMVFDDPMTPGSGVSTQSQRNDHQEAGKMVPGSFHQAFTPPATSRNQQVGKAQMKSSEHERVKQGGIVDTKRDQSQLTPLGVPPGNTNPNMPPGKVVTTRDSPRPGALTTPGSAPREVTNSFHPAAMNTKAQSSLISPSTFMGERNSHNGPVQSTNQTNITTNHGSISITNHAIESEERGQKRRAMETSPQIPASQMEVLEELDQAWV
jgi:hypothetical protein